MPRSHYRKKRIALTPDYFAERILQLRLASGASARDMSLSLGQAENYINSIENKKRCPSAILLLYICEYFKITPHEFFDEDNRYPIHLNALIADLKYLDEIALLHIAGIVKIIISAKS